MGFVLEPAFGECLHKSFMMLYRCGGVTGQTKKTRKNAEPFWKGLNVKPISGKRRTLEFRSFSLDWPWFIDRSPRKFNFGNWICRSRFSVARHSSWRWADVASSRHFSWFTRSWESLFQFPMQIDWAAVLKQAPLIEFNASGRLSLP